MTKEQLHQYAHETAQALLDQGLSSMELERRLSSAKVGEMSSSEYSEYLALVIKTMREQRRKQ